MPVLLVAEHDNSKLNDTVRSALTAALMLGDDVHVLVAGYQAITVAETAACLNGVRKVLYADSPSLAHGLGEPLAALIAALAAPYGHILAAATSHGKNVMPRLAALLDVMQISEVTAVLAADTFERPIYAGSAIETVCSTDDKKVLTVRASAFPAVALSTSAVAAFEEISLPALPDLSTLISASATAGERPDLGAAKIVVAGGRALGSAEQFQALVVPLADKLGAAVGATRAAVDAGYAPNEWQVGQSGRIVAPDLYFAIGISGAVQHLAGMKDSKIIVAVNKDADAPIFQIADYGLVGDLFEIVPALMQALDQKEGP